MMNKMIKVGQIYKEKELPEWRKHDSQYIAIVGNFNPTGNSFAIIRADGQIDYVQKCWLETDCELIAEYPTWNEAVNSKEFKGE